MRYYYCKGRADQILHYARSAVGLRTLAIITVGDDPASEAYVRGKLNDAAKSRIDTIHIKFSKDTKYSTVKATIDWLNSNRDVNGIILQLPTTFTKSDEKQLANCVHYRKDVDGLAPSSKYKPCTALGVMDIIHQNIVSIRGLRVLVIGRSKLAGEPIAQMCLAEDATVTIAHSCTKNLNELLAQNDIIISAAGRPRLVNLQLCKQAKLVVDVGINRVDGKLVGDCYNMDDTGSGTIVTPVPGGVGLMTRAMLMANVTEIDILECDRRIMNL